MRPNIGNSNWYWLARDRLKYTKKKDAEPSQTPSSETKIAKERNSTTSKKPISSTTKQSKHKRRNK